MILGQEEASIGLGFVVLWVLVSTLFGWWGKSKAEDHNAPGWLGFVVVFGVAFFFSLLGALIAVYVLVPIIAQAWAKSHDSRGPVARNYGGTMVYQPPPDPYGAAPTAPMPQQPAADGTIACPACGARVKADRRSCMACGTMLR